MKRAKKTGSAAFLVLNFLYFLYCQKNCAKNRAVSSGILFSLSISRISDSMTVHKMTRHATIVKKEKVKRRIECQFYSFLLAH